MSSRLRATLRPDWTRTLAARRTAAGLLVVLAAVAALRPDPAGERSDVVIALRDLPPGAPLTIDDIAVESRLATTVPDGATGDVGVVLGGHSRRARTPR